MYKIPNYTLLKLNYQIPNYSIPKSWEPQISPRFFRFPSLGTHYTMAGPHFNFFASLWLFGEVYYASSFPFSVILYSSTQFCLYFWSPFFLFFKFMFSSNVIRIWKSSQFNCFSRPVLFLLIILILDSRTCYWFCSNFMHADAGGGEVGLVVLVSGNGWSGIGSGWRVRS